jgi:hypothetical protein
MADLEDVSTILASTIAGLLTGAGGIPLNGVQTDVFPGWPKPNDLKAALASGGVQVSVYPMPGASSNVTRHQSTWAVFTPSTITTAANISGRLVTFSGTITLPLNVSAAMGRISALYAVQAGDTLEDIAAGLADALQVEGISAVSNGVAMTVPGNDPVIIRFGSRAVLAKESFRTKQVFTISTWAPSAALRKATLQAFQGNLFASPRIALDGGFSTGILLFQREVPSDHSEVSGLYRRDLYASVEFSVFEFADAWDVLKLVSNIGE